MKELARRAALFARAWLDAVRLRSVFAQVQRYCFFIGWPRSGHSIVATLLNAHPHAVISHELNALEQVRRGRIRNHLYASILLRDQWFAAQERRSQGYNYLLPGQHQGSFRRLTLIGDKNGGASSRLLGRDPGLLLRLRGLVGVPLRIIRVVRNPWDVIATIARKHSMSLPQARAWFFAMARDQLVIERYLWPGELYSLVHADLIAAPREGLRELAGFLGLEPRPDWLGACAASLFPRPHKSREQVVWSPDERAAIAEELPRYPFFRRWVGQAR